MVFQLNLKNQDMKQSVFLPHGLVEVISEEINQSVTGKALALNGIQFILEDLDWLRDHTSISGMSIRSLYEDLKFLRSFLERMQNISSFHHSRVKVLLGDLLKVVQKLLVATDSCVHRNLMEKNTISLIPSSDFDLYSSEIDSLAKNMMAVKLSAIHNGPEGSSFSSSESSTTRKSSLSSIVADQTMIGFDDDRRELLDKLIGPEKQLKVISIIGMGGIGKTTLAQTLFNDPQVVYHFHVRAWTFLSENKKKGKSLRNILSFMIDAKDPGFNIDEEGMDEESMGEKLYRSLKRKRYLIVIDGLWDIEQWNDMKMYFPDDNTSSRIMLTSRNTHVALKISPDPPHLLRFLTPSESWDLFRFKVFPENNVVPETLRKLGKDIVERCQGLPLAICVVAGILVKEEKAEEQWRVVVENIRMPYPFKKERTKEFSEHYVDILELSYKHLSLTLQSCFLYLGTYSEDSSIPARRLMFSWTAEGFIQKTQTTDKSLEDVAEHCLQELVHRSLVIVVEKRSDGGIKSCRIHDLLRDLCHKKLEEKKFLQPICQCGAWCRAPVYADRIPSTDIFRAFQKCSPNFHFYRSPFYQSEYEVFTEGAMPVYRFLRRLDLKNVILLDFPKQILVLFHLRYLELQVDRVTSHLSSVFLLWNLETCILHVDKGGRIEDNGGGIEVPYEFWNMLKLRHLQISQELVFSDPRHFAESIDEAIHSTVLEDLRTISRLRPSGSVNNVLARTRNLRKLGLHMSLYDSNEHFDFPNLAHLDLLQTLKFEYQTLESMPHIISQLQLHKFPPNLKKLTLIGSYLQWEEISVLSMLPNLEILKLKDNFFTGESWETSDDGFCHLKFLKLSNMDLQKWISFSDHFPKLEHLVLNDCQQLEGIPLEFGDIPTLETIKVYRSSKSTVESAKEIQSMGNDDLKVFIYHQFEEVIQMNHKKQSIFAEKEYVKN